MREMEVAQAIGRANAWRAAPRSYPVASLICRVIGHEPDGEVLMLDDGFGPGLVASSCARCGVEVEECPSATSR